GHRGRARANGRGRARDRRGGRAPRPAAGDPTLGAPAQPVRRSDERDPGRAAAPLPRGRRGGRAAAAALDRRHRGRAEEHRMSLREQLEREAADAAAAVPRLTDGAVTDALERAAALVVERREAIAVANAADVEAAGGLDAGSL